MKTVLVTGGIGSGKSEVCRYLAAKGYPVYDSDSRCKALYDSVPGLKARIEAAIGLPFSEIGVIFTDEGRRKALEAVVYPELISDFIGWRDSQPSDLCFLESAIALEKPEFDRLYDEVWIVRADLETRLKRNPKAEQRASIQHTDYSRADAVIDNNSTLQSLHEKIDSLL